MIGIPNEVSDWIRNVFAVAGQSAATKLAANPNAHEPWMDFAIIESLQRFSTPHIVKTGWSVALDTHWLGGYPMFSRWEVADFGLLITFAAGSKIVRSKIALLQAKRLYAKEVRAESEVEFLDYYRRGFGRLFLKDEQVAETFRQKTFAFDDGSKYRALLKGDEQWNVIKKYEKEKQTPVYYLLYNPPAMPTSVVLPHVGSAPVYPDKVGCRIIPAANMRTSMAGLKKGDSPTYGGLIAKLPQQFRSSPHLGGWRLEHFIADLLIQCKGGRVADLQNDEGLFNAFYRRSAPISAAISIVVGGPEGFGFDVEPDESSEQT